MRKGYSIIEILVVIAVFVVLGILATQSISLSLQSSKKSDSIVLVKQELDNAAGSIERLLQTASYTITSVDCVAENATASVGFRDSKGARGDIACLDTSPLNFYGSSTDPRIASSSGETIRYNQRYTSGRIQITNCSFSCYTQNSTTYIDFTVTANAKGISSGEGATVTT